MYFKRLEMHGFKSFAEPVIIEFHEGVTCIVGPNGSGKSNISDAIRWVLGEQSPKTLRGGKMEEVIFAGTASRKSRGMAEVTLIIDNSTGILDIDYNEVAITRRMFRSGESEYLINNNQCRLRDIRELIMDTGIGVDGYSIIGQGKIADIVSNKPESRREIFEESAGVVMYKNKKAEAERKFESANNNLDRVNDIIGEIEDRIGGLSDDSVKAQEYLKLKEKYRDLEINITLKNIDNIDKKNESYRNDILELKGQIDSISKEKKSIDEEIEKTREKSNNLEKLGNEAREKQLKFIEEINNLTNRNQLNEERLSSIEKDTARINNEITVLDERLEKEDNNFRELTKTKAEIETEYKEASEELQKKIENYNEIVKRNTDLSEKIDSGKDRLFSLSTLISTKSSEAKSIENLKETLEKRKKQIQSETSDIKKNNADSLTQLNTAKEAYKTASANKNRIESESKQILNEQSELIRSQRTLNLKIEDLKIKGSQMSSRKKTIEEMENNYEGYNFAVKYIMRANLPGIEGVTSDLMKVPSGYEIAIETALGAMMQNIVCDDDNHAKAAVNILKENRAGRLTFLPMDSIRGSRAVINRDISSDAGYKGIAADCITFDEKYQNIFDYLLGRVAVVDNMDTAIRLSKAAGKSIRFVTLDGEIINASGAITGGKYKNKSANLLERKGEIIKLEKEIDEIRQQIIYFIKESKDANERLEKLEIARKENSESLKKEEISLASLDASIKALEDSLRDINMSSDKSSKELESIAGQIKDANQMIGKLEENINKAKIDMSDINKEIENDLEIFDKSKESSDSASEEITKVRIAVSDHNSRKENTENLISRILETMEDYSFQIEDKKKQLSKLDEEKNQIIFGHRDTDGIQAKVKEKEELEKYIESVAKERAEVVSKSDVLSKNVQTANERLNSYQDQKYQLEIKQAKNDTQLDTLKNRLWEDFEISYIQAIDFKKENFVMSTSVKESREIRNRIRELGEVNVGAIKEYEQVSERYKFLTDQRSDITMAMQELKSIITDMDNAIKSRFKDNFDQIVVNFESIFRELFGGGHAELRMEEENNPLESGIDIIAQPPGKKLQNINLMSGGEKTMTAIALMFAVLKTKPTPFCILDEVEAALDDANIDRFANYLRKFENIQFTLVTHQKATMEHADVLYGVTMPEQGISKVLSLRLGDDFEL